MSSLRRGALGFALPLFLCAPAAAQTSSALAWPEATRESRPWTRWWWLGSAVDRENLTAELETLHAAGIGGVEVTSIYGVKGYEDRFRPYLSQSWTEMLRHTVSEAAKRDMGVDMPPGSGWRTGGPLVPESDANASLHLRVDTVRSGELWQADFEGKHVDAVAAVSEDGQYVALPRDSGSIRWRAPEGTWHVYVAETRFSGDRVKRPAPGGEGYALDVFSRAAVERFLDAYGEQLGELPGGGLRAYFHDSFEYSGNGSKELFESFRQRQGYSLERHLPALVGHGDPEEVARVKSDYRETMHAMLMDNLLRPLTRWSHQRGSLSRNQAHGSPGNLLDLYAASDIPETEIFGPLGGTDSDPLVSKFASSAAHVAGKRLVSAEAMTWLNEHFNVTLEELKQAVDQLFVSGVNHVIYHGTAYSPQEAPWPGWLFYASTQLNSRNAIWRDVPALNRYITRVQSVLQSGRSDNDVLLYWPIYDSWSNPEGLRINFKVHKPDWLHRQPVGAAARTLWATGFGFDYVSDRQLLEQVSAEEGLLQAAADEYRVLLVPDAERMPLKTLGRMLELALNGASVAFLGGLPADVPGLGDLEARREELRRLSGALSFVATETPGVRRAKFGQGAVLVGEDLSALLSAAGVVREELVDHPGVRFIRRRHAEGHHYFITHGGAEALEAWVPLSVSAEAVAILDPVSGRSGLARTRTGRDGRTEVWLQLQPGASLVLRSFDRRVEAAAWTYVESAAAPHALQGEWQVEFVAGGPDLPGSFRTDSLYSWTESGDPAARSFAGTARYSLRFDAPAEANNYLLQLGRVAESARVRLNGKDLGTLFAHPFQVQTGPLRPTGNLLEIEVTNLSANRIRDLDRRGVEWRIFHDINFVNIDYKPFDASNWAIRNSGLLGPVTLQPLRSALPAEKTTN